MSPRQPPLLPHYNFNLMRQIETNGKFYCKIASGAHVSCNVLRSTARIKLVGNNKIIRSELHVFDLRTTDAVWGGGWRAAKISLSYHGAHTRPLLQPKLEPVTFSETILTVGCNQSYLSISAQLSSRL